MALAYDKSQPIQLTLISMATENILQDLHHS